MEVTAGHRHCACAGVCWRCKYVCMCVIHFRSMPRHTALALHRRRWAAHPPGRPPGPPPGPPPIQAKAASPGTPPVVATSSKAKAPAASQLGRGRIPRPPTAPPPAGAREHGQGHPQCRNETECMGHAGLQLYTHVSFAFDEDRDADVYCRGCMKFWQQSWGQRILIFRPMGMPMD